MNTRSTRTRKTNRMFAYIAAAVIHVVLIAALVLNFTNTRKVENAVYAEKIDVVQATTIDESQIREQEELIKRKELEEKQQKQKELNELKKLKEQSEEEKKRLEDIKEKQKEETAEAERLEKERKEIELKEKKEREESDKRAKERADEERKDKEKKEKERKEREQKQLKEQQERDLKEEQERLERERRETQRAEEERLLKQKLAAENQAKERATTLLGKYTALIQERVGRYRTISPDYERWRKCTMNVKLSPSGEVLSVRVLKSSGLPRFDRSVETAIYQASPLPIPSQYDDPAVNKEFRNLNIIFDMSGLN